MKYKLVIGFTFKKLDFYYDTIESLAEKYNALKQALVEDLDYILIHNVIIKADKIAYVCPYKDTDEGYILIEGW